MTKKILFFITAVFIFLFAASGSEAADISLDDFINRHDASFRWDPLKDTGEIIINNNVFSFKTGTPWIVYNYREKISNSGVYRKDGKIMLEKPALFKIEEKLGIVRDRDTIFTGHRIAAVLIDPGHGGRDPGAIGRHSGEDGENFTLYEKDIVLKVSLMLQDLLKTRYNDKRILLTRDDDSYPSLESRVELANSIKLDTNEAIVFVSVHANASFNRNARGFEVWYLPPEYRRDLIDKNTLDQSYQDIIPILNTILEEEYTIESILLASYILDGMENKVGNMSPNRGLKEEIWFVVRNAKMPSVLIELGFVTNKEESLLLNDNDYLKKLAEGIYNGINRFIENLETISVGGVN